MTSGRNSSTSQAGAVSYGRNTNELQHTRMHANAKTQTQEAVQSGTQRTRGSRCGESKGVVVIAAGLQPMRSAGEAEAKDNCLSAQKKSNTKRRPDSAKG